MHIDSPRIDHPYRLRKTREHLTIVQVHDQRNLQQYIRNNL